MELQMANCDLHKSWKGKKKYEVFLVKSWASTRLSLWLELISMFRKMQIQNTNWTKLINAEYILNYQIKLTVLFFASIET